ncbi:TPM domain-containing protein [Euzebya tangerina]|uniref:TPM domain-containing protein n=1 Tax=Euzebya tangerina TaxID=591198 RepID=UPI000E3185CE|nr:TPM domain-containing protein [Euzebya tangerina]
MRTIWLAAALAVLVAGCGEPPVDVSILDRSGYVQDQADVLDQSALESRLADIGERGLDIVVLTYETEQANCGEAFRAGLEFVQAWEADVALVAVARPGDFTSTEEDRERCLGVRPVDDFAVSAGLREEIAEDLVPPIAADNNWDEAFEVAIDRLAEELLDEESS